MAHNQPTVSDRAQRVMLDMELHKQEAVYLQQQKTFGGIFGTLVKLLMAITVIAILTSNGAKVKSFLSGGIESLSTQNILAKVRTNLL